MRITITTISLLAVPALLAGCGEKKAVEVKNASASEVASKVTDAGIHFQPGAWETTAKMADVSIEGLSPEMAAAMKSAMAQNAAGPAHVTRTCLTPEKAEKPDSTFFGKGDSHCTYKDFTMGGGKIAGTMACKDEGGDRTMTMNGSYTPDSYTMDMTMAGDHGGKAMTMHLVATSHRVGDCRPDDRTN
ncbi:DUF3617 domain-containing protein [Novosphingobium sp.]|uniref:DUF3617 domain-containing protein n=1 Tax=Novosphingobium sp. TaxID=1874826 RepID=UPI00333FC668